MTALTHDTVVHAFPGQRQQTLACVTHPITHPVTHAVTHPVNTLSNNMQQQELCVRTCRFEALSTQQTSVDATSEYVAVIRLRLDKLRILMAAEVDCYDPTKVKPGHKPDLASYLELKTYV